MTRSIMEKDAPKNRALDPKQTTEEGQRVQDMLSEGGGVVEPNVPVPTESISSRAAIPKPQSRNKFLAWVAGWFQKPAT